MLAHGADPIDLPNLPPALCWRINHLDAYLNFRDRLGEPGALPPQRVLIAGAGLVGCELANDLALAGYPVTLLDLCERPLSSLLTEAQSNELLAAWRDLPLTFVGGVDITGVGRQFEAEHVIAAVGLRTPSRLAQSAGLSWNNGIAVDPVTLHTDVATIHALGDCISIGGEALRFIEPIARQARQIAATIRGETSEPYVRAAPPVRVKTGSKGFTVVR